jgi:peptidyl-prolyl cis-trans isomerase B (cyclophilin B)
VASKRDRQRKLERARTERRIARQAHQARKRRQVQAIVGASAVVVLIILGVIFIIKPFSGSSTPAAGGCLWAPVDPASNSNLVDVGTPPTSGEPTTGTEPMTIATNLGDIVITLDLAKSPCAAASFTYLGSKNFFNNSSCSQLSTNLETLQCGDPKSNGTGGPAYQFADEYMPLSAVSPAPTPSGAPPTPTPVPTGTGSPTYYTAGQVVMVNTGANTNGSMFYIIWGDTSPLSNAYTLVGSVTSGMDIVNKVVAAGAIDDTGKVVAEGKPKTTLTFQSVSVGAPPTPSAGASGAVPSGSVPVSTSPAQS